MSICSYLKVKVSDSDSLSTKTMSISNYCNLIVMLVDKIHVISFLDTSVKISLSDPCVHGVRSLGPDISLSSLPLFESDFLSFPLNPENGNWHLIWSEFKTHLAAREGKISFQIRNTNPSFNMEFWWMEKKNDLIRIENLFENINSS